MPSLSLSPFPFIFGFQMILLLVYIWPSSDNLSMKKEFRHYNSRIIIRNVNSKVLDVWSSTEGVLLKNYHQFGQMPMILKPNFQRKLCPGCLSWVFWPDHRLNGHSALLQGQKLMEDIKVEKVGRPGSAFSWKLGCNLLNPDSVARPAGINF